ncbi:hypothetical protein F2P56_015197 [Juglans regia]|uniref:Uncharacterized protein n=2 Tax=Juglans regia TaxID=51240 RepID=A0A834CUM9_JUGRE|nr:uncharacterized protein LOC108982814 [Juglans regia]KAF5465168.1 hypothetical protein F2P56_015197 [Juglans regia]
MDVGHVIPSRPWLFDLDVTIHGRSISCSFVFNGEKIHLNPLPPKPVGSQQAKKIVEQKGLNIVNPTEFERTLVGDSVVFTVVVMEVPMESPIVAPAEVQSFLQKMNPTEHAKLQRQVDKVLYKGFIRDSLSPCAVPALLTPKKYGSWRMYIEA